MEEETQTYVDGAAKYIFKNRKFTKTNRKYVIETLNKISFFIFFALSFFFYLPGWNIIIFNHFYLFIYRLKALYIIRDSFQGYDEQEGRTLQRVSYSDESLIRYQHVPTLVLALPISFGDRHTNLVISNIRNPKKQKGWNTLELSSQAKLIIKFIQL